MFHVCWRVGAGDLKVEGLGDLGARVRSLNGLRFVGLGLIVQGKQARALPEI